SSCCIFYSDGHHRDLHSFPTRRSSDLGEVDGVLALFGDRHGGGEEVELAGVQRGNDAIPVGGHHFAFHFHLGAQRVGDIQVETRSEEHTSELQSRENLVCPLLLEKKKK